MSVLLLPITLISTSVAIVMSVVAWRVSREERRRSEARISALASDIRGTSDAVDFTPGSLPRSGSAAARLAIQAPAQVARAPVRLAVASPVPLEQFAAEGDMFSASRRGNGQSHWGLALIAGVLAVAAAAAVAVLFNGESHSAAVRAASPVARTTSVSDGSGRDGAIVGLPLDLIALGQERDGDRLIVRGVIQNPAGGAKLDRLVAVVFGFGRDGEFRTSGRSPLPSQALLPGARSNFVVTVPDAADVVRYRVSFRTDDHVVSHADRRPTH